MRLWDIIKQANSNLLRNKSRTFLTVLAIFVGAFTIMMTTAINTGVNDYIDKQVNSVGAEDYLQIVPSVTADQMLSMITGNSYDVQEYQETSKDAKSDVITEADIKELNDMPEIRNVKPYKMISTDYITRGKENDKKYKLSASIIPTDSLRLDLAAGKNADMDSDQAQIVLPDKYLDALGFKDASDAVGKTVMVGVTNNTTKQISETEMTIVGVQNQSVVGFGSAWVNDAAGKAVDDITMAGLPDMYRNQTYAVVAQINDDYMAEDKVDVLKDKLLDMGYTGITLNDSIEMIRSFFNAITTVLTIFGVIALVAASIGIINTLFMSVQERTREIGLMKAMGLGGGKIFGMFSIEAISLGFWGGILGLIVALITRNIVNPLATKTFLAGLPGFTLVEFNPLYLVLIIIIVMVIAFLAGTLPARRAAGKDPIEALRYE